MVRVCLINEPDRLLYEDFLLQLVVQKGVVNVDFLQTPVIRKVRENINRMVEGLTTGLNVSV